MLCFMFPDYLTTTLAHGLVAEHHAPNGKHLGQIAQGELVTQAPEHQERDHVGRLLHPVQQGAAALVELLPALAAAEPAIALCGALGPLDDRRRPALGAPHSRPPHQ